MFETLIKYERTSYKKKVVVYLKRIRRMREVYQIKEIINRRGRRRRRWEMIFLLVLENLFGIELFCYFQNLMASKSFWLIQGLRLFILHPPGPPWHLPYDQVTGDRWIMCLYIRVAASIVPFILLLQKITLNPHNNPIIFEYVRDSTAIYITACVHVHTLSSSSRETYVVYSKN